MKEVTLITFKSEVKEWNYPSIEFNEFKAKDNIVSVHDCEPTVIAETYKAKVHVFHEHREAVDRSFMPPDERPVHIIETRIALDKESQKIVDMFVKSREVEMEQTIENYRKAWQLEKDKTCHDRFVDWLETTRLIKWLKS